MTMNSERTIFIVDDNPQNLNVLSDMLEAEGYKTRASLDAQAMFESIKFQKPDLIILDIHMPKMDGYEACETLKASPQFRDIPVIFCSALGETYNIVKAFELGGVDYITKPFRSQEVLARVRTHIDLMEKQTSLEEALHSLKSVQSHLIQTEKMTSIGTLVAGIGHEINNPINYIINSLLGFKTDFEDVKRLLDFYTEKEQLPECPFADEARELKKEIEFQILIKEMAELLDGMYEGVVKVHDVVASLKMLAGNDDGEESRVDVASEIERAVSLVRHLFDERVVLRLDLRDLPEIRQQPGRISRIVLQLLKNALDAVRRKEGSGAIGEVSVAAFRQSDASGNVIIIRVSDTGCGISGEDLTQVYDPFYTTKDIGKGIGLGLTTCYHGIRNMGGTLDISSTPGEGTEITITIPVS